MRKHGRTDNNHGEIVAALRAAGYAVRSTADVGGGFPDLIVGAPGVNVLFEIKAGKVYLTPDEAAFFNRWLGPRYVVTSAEEALRRMADEVSALSAPSARSANALQMAPMGA